MKVRKGILVPVGMVLMANNKKTKMEIYWAPNQEVGDRMALGLVILVASHSIKGQGSSCTGGPTAPSVMTSSQSSLPRS